MTAPHSGPHHGQPYDASPGYDGYYNQLSAANKRTDALLTRAVISRRTTAQPASPSDGDRYILPASPTGAAWSGNAGKVAWYDGGSGAWVFYSPEIGWEFHCTEEYRLIRFGSGGWAPHGPVIAALAPSLQAAIDSLNGAGGEVELGIGYYTQSTSVTVPTGVKLRGAGQNQTIIQCTSTSEHAIKVVGQYIEISNLTILGPNSAGSGCGIFMQMPSVSDAAYNRIFDVRIANTASWSINLPGGASDPPDIAIVNTFENVRCELALSNGNLYVGQGCTNNRFYLCQFATEVGYAAHVYQAIATQFSNCLFERLADSVMVRLEICFSTSFDTCWFETHNATDPPTNFMIETVGACVAATFLTPHIDFDNVAVPRFIKTSTTGPVRQMLIVNPFVRIKSGSTPGTTELFGALPSSNRADIYCQLASDEVQVLGGVVIDIGYAHADTFRIGGLSAGYGLICAAGNSAGGFGHLKMAALTSSQVSALPNPYGGKLVYDDTLKTNRSYINGIGYLQLPPMFVGTSFPGTPASGYLWLDTSSGFVLKVYTGSAWKAVTLT